MFRAAVEIGRPHPAELDVEDGKTLNPESQNFVG
jgi:hypothetical protein